MRPGDRNGHGRAEQHRGTKSTQGGEGVETNCSFHGTASRLDWPPQGGWEFLLK
jgi:hypothetical protein